jgi:hypothetical protein
MTNITIDREYRYLDKSAWGDGPWQSEPDKQQFIDEATGLDCLLVRNPWSGHWCGYVGVPEGHPLFGLHYDAADDHAAPDDEGYRQFRVHGGLTFADICQEGGEETSICHVPAPGRPDRVFWFGFDAAHAGDLRPGDAPLFAKLKMRHNTLREVYRTAEYMQAECARLAAQLAHIREEKP